MICGSGGSKSRLTTAAGVEPSGEMRDEKLHSVVARNYTPRNHSLIGDLHIFETIGVD